MNIAFLSVFYPYRGGIAQFNAQLYKALVKKHNVTAYNFTRLYPKLIFPGKSQFVSPDDEADQIETIRILDSINPLTYRKTMKKILAQKPDLLLIQYWNPIVAPSLGYIAGKIKNKNIITLSIIANIKSHESVPFERLITKWYINQNDGIIILAEAGKRDLLELKPDAKYFVHPHPNYEHFGERLCKIEARKMLGIPENKKVLLYFGFIRHYKGLDILLEAFSELGDEYFLIVAGECYGSFDKYQKIIDNNNLGNRILLQLEYLKDSEISPYFSAADVCVLPYRSATQSGIVGIAYHFGLPIIATDVGGLREVIEPYETGIIIDKTEPTLLSNAIQSFFQQNMAEQFIANVNKFGEKYNWDTLADGIVSFAEEIKSSSF